jgi:hypothetical protein
LLRLKRLLEQAQPSMSKRLKVVASSKAPGKWLACLFVVLGLALLSIEIPYD